MGTDPTAISVRLDAATLAAGSAWGALIFGALEATRVDALPFAAALAATTSSTLVGAAPALGFLTLLAVAPLLTRPRARIAAQGAFGAGFAAILFAGIRSDEVVASHPAVWATFVALVVAVTIELALRIRWPRATIATSSLAFAGGMGGWLANYRFAPNVYFEAHWAVTNVALAMLGLGAALAALAVARPRFRAAFIVTGFGLVALCAALRSEPAMRQVAADTEIGRARLLVAPPAATAQPTGTPSSAADAPALLTDARAFDLPPGFDLDDFDLLFVATEAIRRDDTSLHAPALRTTPQMQRWREAGALDLTRGYAPSSGTLQSLASWFALAPVACTELDIYKPHWAGRLRPEALTAAEIFAAAGRHTFWIGHNFRNLFDEKLFGFEQGFDTVARTPEPNKSASATADDRTGDAAAAHIRALAPDRRFFGFVMFSAPHFSYVKHFDDMPSRTARDRYRQEIRKADAQLGKLFDALQATGRLDRTIVIITADHGEEFGDHGATGHNRTLFEESIHVPLLVWLPGARPRDLDRPVSTAWLLPWLMLHASPAVADPVAARLAAAWGPLLGAIDGRVVAEIIRGQQTVAALIDRRTKLHLDVAAQRAYAFDLDKDPRERERRFALTPDELASIDALTRARSGCRKVHETGKRPPKTDR